MATTKTKTVHTVIYDTNSDGPMGDGTMIARFSSLKSATAFAARNTHYGHPASVQTDSVPARIAARWAISA